MQTHRQKGEWGWVGGWVGDVRSTDRNDIYQNNRSCATRIARTHSPEEAAVAVLDGDAAGVLDLLLDQLEV